VIRRSRNASFAASCPDRDEGHRASIRRALPLHVRRCVALHHLFDAGGGPRRGRRGPAHALELHEVLRVREQGAEIQDVAVLLLYDYYHPSAVDSQMPAEADIPPQGCVETGWLPAYSGPCSATLTDSNGTLRECASCAR
jgi:hypothetical protein